MFLKKAKDIGDNWYYIEALNRGAKIGIYTDKNRVIIGRGFYSETGQEIKFDIDVKNLKITRYSQLVMVKMNISYLLIQNVHTVKCAR